jgi:peptidyl-Lys metalloendopeptidase
MLLKHVVVTLLLVAVASCELAARVSLNSATYSRGDNVILQWEIINTGAPSHILRWGTPLEGEWNSNMFVIQNENGESAVYNGKILKRGPPTSEHFSEISAVSGELVLSEGYQFPLAGNYFITLAISVTTREGLSLKIQSNTVELNVVSADIMVERSQGAHAVRVVNYIGCDATQTTTAATAISNALVAVLNVNTYLGQTLPPSCSEDYVEWFGIYSDSNWQKIQQDFLNMTPFLQNLNFGIDCSTCVLPGVYAYVFPTDTDHIIYLCAAFWGSPPGPYETDSQSGTVIHELSHFNDIAATADNAYGQTDCRALAISDIPSALNNADSHEYLAEASPVCLTGGSGGDPHIFTFDGQDVNLQLFGDNKNYVLFTNDELRVVIRTSGTERRSFITAIGITYRSHHLLAHFNGTEAEFLLDDVVIDQSEITPIGEMKVFTPDPTKLTGPLAEESRYLLTGLQIANIAEIVAGLRPGSGPFFNIQVLEQHYRDESGLILAVSNSNFIRDADWISNFETDSLF